MSEKHPITVEEVHAIFVAGYKELSPSTNSNDAAQTFSDWYHSVKADAWDEGAETAWKATGDGHNGEYAHPFGTHDGTAPFQLANPNTPNPYRKQEETR